MTVRSIQRLVDPGSLADIEALAQTFLMTVSATLTEMPGYWSKNRDDWLDSFWRKPGNDLLAGAISTLAAKTASASWFVEGPMALATMYRDILLNQSEFGAGWTSFIYKWVQGYLTRDAGGLAERQRTSVRDREGPALGFAHLDESKSAPTQSPDFPIVYNKGDKLVKVHRANVMPIIDMPNGRDKFRGVGFSAVSRAYMTAAVLMDIVKYKRQRLSNLPPAGLLVINNMLRTQWEDLQKQYNAEQSNIGNTVYQDLMVAFGYDPAYQLTVEMIEFSSLPEHFDEGVATEIAIYTFALALRVDPRELWPVSAGVLGGTAREVEIQHRKAKAKGEGAIFSAIERQLNNPLSLPKGVSFRFDFIDDEEDRQAAEINQLKIQNVRKMWESSPNRQSGEFGGPGRPVQGEADMEGPSENEIGREGIISTEEARELLVRWNIVPPDVLGLTPDVERLYDIKHYGPPARAYSDGRVVFRNAHAVLPSV